MKSMKPLPSILILSFLLTINLTCTEVDKIDASSSKQKNAQSNEFPAFNQELIININGDSISGYALIASGEMSKATVILIPGYPGNDSNFDVAQEIRRNGRNVILFNHRGAWGSQGIYTYSNCLEDIGLLIDYLSQKGISKKLRIDPDKFILIGRSYGGGIALIKGSQISSVKKIIALSSVNYGNIMKKYQDLAELSNFKKYMKKQIMINTDIDSFLQELLDNKSAFNISNYSDQLANKEVLLIEDSKKNEQWISKLKKKEYLLLESDHNFIDKRIELTNLIVNWINK